MKRLEVDIEGKKEWVYAALLDGEIWLHWRGQTLIAADSEREARKGRSAASSATGGAGQIKAPMPGKVTQLKVKVGSQVQAGETLLIMEAMKMEYTLVADRAGAVTAIQCQAGEPVKLGQVLVQIEGAEK